MAAKTGTFETDGEVMYVSELMFIRLSDSWFSLSAAERGRRRGELCKEAESFKCLSPFFSSMTFEVFKVFSLTFT